MGGASPFRRCAACELDAVASASSFACKAFCDAFICCISRRSISTSCAASFRKRGLRDSDSGDACERHRCASHDGRRAEQFVHDFPQNQFELDQIPSVQTVWDTKHQRKSLAPRERNYAAMLSFEHENVSAARMHLCCQFETKIFPRRDKPASRVRTGQSISDCFDSIECCVQ